MATDFDSFRTVDQALKDRLFHAVTVTNAVTGGMLLKGYCESFVRTQDRLHLKGLLADTSDRHQGILLTQRWSWNDSFEIGGMIIYALRPIDEQERRAWEKPA